MSVVDDFEARLAKCRDGMDDADILMAIMFFAAGMGATATSSNSFEHDFAEFSKFGRDFLDRVKARHAQQENMTYADP